MGKFNATLIDLKPKGRIFYISAQKNPALIKLGKKIREFRKEKGFSQESFAYEVGLDRTYMGSVEIGERNIAILNLIRIAKTLSIEVGELFPAIRSLRVD